MPAVRTFFARRDDPDKVGAADRAAVRVPLVGTNLCSQHARSACHKPVARFSPTVKVLFQVASARPDAKGILPAPRRKKRTGAPPAEAGVTPPLSPRPRRYNERKKFNKSCCC